MLKVLIVEDEELIRRGIALSVDWASLDCVVAGEAADGEEGLAAALRCRPDLIITDLKMPKMDGLEMLRRLREAGVGSYVIILTAYDRFGYAQSALRLGAVDFLLKPFHDGELEEAVARLKSRLEAKRAEAVPSMPALPEARVQGRYVREAMEYMNGHLSDPDLSVGDVAAHLGISESRLSHIFKKETACTPLSYLTRCRIRRAMELLRDCRTRVYAAAEAVGYRDIAYFSAAFKKMTGMPPSEYQASAGGDRQEEK